MKLAEMLNAYAQSTGDKIMHRVGVAEALVQLIETSRASRMNAIDQFRDAMIGYVNESVELMKSADITDKDELVASIRTLIEDMHADRRAILAGEAPTAYNADALPKAFKDLVSAGPSAPPGLDLPPFSPPADRAASEIDDGSGDKDGRRAPRSAA